MWLYFHTWGEGVKGRGGKPPPPCMNTPSRSDGLANSFVVKKSAWKPFRCVATEGQGRPEVVIEKADELKELTARAIGEVPPLRSQVDPRLTTEIPRMHSLDSEPH